MSFYDEEWQVIFRAVFLGMELSLLYDLLRGLRRVKKGAWGWTFVCDALFWYCTAVASFRLMHEYSNGLFRWYTVGAVFCGMWLYTKTLGWLLHKLLCRMAGILAVPAKIVLTKWKSLAIIKAYRERKEADTG
ncbi:MAG: spore cortex biosynthesis protein YabQ [Lachnospiraceae bacterium]|nr:spore cortex biosynthesis protein YabQ [Lachnospiraceae bacterium]